MLVLVDAPLQHAVVEEGGAAIAEGLQEAAGAWRSRPEGPANEISIPPEYRGVAETSRRPQPFRQLRNSWKGGPSLRSAARPPSLETWSAVQSPGRNQRGRKEQGLPPEVCTPSVRPRHFQQPACPGMRTMSTSYVHNSPTFRFTPRPKKKPCKSRLVRQLDCLQRLGLGPTVLAEWCCHSRCQGRAGLRSCSDPKCSSVLSRTAHKFFFNGLYSANGATPAAGQTGEELKSQEARTEIGQTMLPLVGKLAECNPLAGGNLTSYPKTFIATPFHRPCSANGRVNSSVEPIHYVSTLSRRPARRSNVIDAVMANGETCGRSQE